MSKVKFIHLREHEFSEKYNRPVNAVKGGVTVAFISDESGVKFAVSICHEKDNYCKRTGRVKSEGRLKSKKVHVILRETIPEDMNDYDAVMVALRQVPGVSL